jgi:hypothetical protein
MSANQPTTQSNSASSPWQTFLHRWSRNSEQSPGFGSAAKPCHRLYGAIGDATVLELAEGDFEYRDVLGEVRAGRQRLKARGLVLAGRWWHPPRA